MKGLCMPIACFLLSYYRVLESHVVDFHPITPSEEREMQEHEKEKNNERDRQIVFDEEKSEEERREALARLIDNEGMV